MAARRNMATIATVLVALALGSVITERLPKPDDITGAPAVHELKLGEPVTMRTGTFTVTGVDASPTLVVDKYSGSHTPYTHLVLTLDYTAKGEPGHAPRLDTVLVAPDGREFSSGVTGASVCGSQPGLPMTCQLAIEVDPKALAGSYVRLPAEDPPGFGPPIMEEAHLDLGLTEEKAAELAAKTEPIQFFSAKPKGA